LAFGRLSFCGQRSLFSEGTNPNQQEPAAFRGSAHHTAAQRSACFLGNYTLIQRSHRMIDKGTFMTDFASVRKHLTAITSAQTDFAKSSFEANKAYFEKLAGVKSPDNFI
jgi:hypothetical protein